MIDTEPIGLAFIGAGGICEQRHLPNLSQLPGVELVSVCNRSPQSSGRVRERWAFRRIEADWRRAIEQPDVDAVFIGVWPYRHREMATAALAAGKHVFCQARLCMDWPEATQMVAAAAARPDLVNMVCPPPQRVRWERMVKRHLSSGAIGELRSVAVVSTSAANCDPAAVSWREQVELSGLNILQVGIFAEILNAWCGPYDSLAATTGIFLREKRDARGQAVEIKIPQVVSIAGTLTSGALATERHTGLAVGPERSEIVLRGSAATCTIDFLAQQVRLETAGDPAPAAVEESGDPWQVERDFIAAVRAARRGEAWHVSPDFAEAALYMRKLQALHDSAAGSRFVKLADITGA
jgi:predicted dehydrogenase